MRQSPSIIPADRLNRDVYLVLEEFRQGAAWRETDESDTDFPTIISDLLSGRYEQPLCKPVRRRQRKGLGTNRLAGVVLPLARWTFWRGLFSAITAVQQNAWVRNSEITMRYLSVGVFFLLSASSSTFAQDHAGKPHEQAACRRDATRFCRQQLNDDFAVQQCLQQNRARLSKACQKVFQDHGM